MKEITNDEITALLEKADSLREEANKIYEEVKTKKRSLLNLDFEGKYIKYIDDFDTNPIYMRVNWVRQDSEYSNFDYSYLFNGFGFFGEFFGYADATEFDWSLWFEFNIHGNEKEFFEKINKIEVITKDEFNEAFKECIKQIEEIHYSIK